ncbi:MAG: ribulose-phosphate 3-epimerase [Legionellales bacterium]|nr:ribulose-phosphate 3-epimerase [Legionellales bacterium]
MLPKSPYILPSLLSANLMALGDEISAIQTAGADFLHLDIMDNHYVPNLTFGPQICHAIHKQFPDLPLDVHLMISPVDPMIMAFAEAGARRISIHPDATRHVDRSLQLIKNAGCQAGLVLNPATSVECIRWSQQHLDFVLLMTVNPGFGGQTLIAATIPKIAQVHAQYPNLRICVDGGITLDNIGLLTAAGAKEFVAGSTIFKSNDYAEIIQKLRQKGIQANA